ncbi:hypothetical protein MYRNA_27 [Mycobacterium phage Myrna]|uniref:Uncharacterized protein n=1 Tax=Mycobacterium phage Myrna TaxID=546805 RepID=B5LJ38_9CAUD|nr:gp27 [Mycobacterium phage Myrna]ACH62035.1 hypothetical protein MYRNA_27 [Mycobacterium phage Myrna]
MYRKWYALHCDYKKCQEHVEPHESKFKARETALATGWEERANRMLCPTHVRKDNERIEEAARQRRIHLARLNLEKFDQMAKASGLQE